MKKLIASIILINLVVLLSPMDATAQKTITRKKTKTEQTSPTKKPSKSKSVKVSEPDGYINGHGYVDLGLPSGLKWATCNVGASSPSGYGSYFAWGETSTKSSYTTKNSKTSGRDLGDISGDPNYDTARAKWGGTWRLPTIAECQELVDKCKWMWTASGGHKGYKVTGPNGNSIFLPAAGQRQWASLNFVGREGRYWSSTPWGEGWYGACFIYFNSSYDKVEHNNRHGCGYNVRPVAE